MIENWKIGINIINLKILILVFGNFSGSSGGDCVEFVMIGICKGKFFRLKIYWLILFDG